MKRIAAVISAVLMCAVIVCGFTLTAFAESTAYEINALNMSIPVPNDMLVLTRDSSENDPFFSTFKLNYDTTMSKLSEGNIYLEAVNKDSSLTLTVTMTKTEDSTEIGSYNNLSDEELANIMKKLRENSTYKDASPVEYKDVKYICLNMSYKSGKKTVQAQQYNTVMNGENINITLQASAGKKLTTANKELLTGIIKETTILNDNFFNRNRGFILYGSITLAAIAIVVVAFILLFRYIRNPNRKHKILVHELAHEHKITETTQIPRKTIFNVIKPTNTFLTKYDPVDELDKGKRRKKKKAEVIPDESREIKSYSEPAAQEERGADEPITSVTYEDAPDEIEVSVPKQELKQQQTADDADAQVETEAKAEAEEKQNDSHIEQPATEEDAPEEQIDISEFSGDIPVKEAEPQQAVQSGENFDEAADYFDVIPEKSDMYAYSDVDTAVEDYSAAKRGDYDEEIVESVSENTIWDTVKKVLAAIGKGIATVFRTIFVVILYLITHIRYFCINLYRMIKRKHAVNKRRKIEEERRRQASERRRMEREAQRTRQRANANRGENDLVQVRSSYERRPAPSGRSRERSDYRRPSQRRR